MSEIIESPSHRFPIHPGKKLKEKLKAHSLSQSEFSRRIGLTASAICRTIAGRGGLTADMALRFDRYFGTPDVWWTIHCEYERHTTRIALKKELSKIVPHNQQSGKRERLKHHPVTKPN